MKTHELDYKGSRIAYTIYGTGERYIACFHGYGQAAYRWAILEPLLGKRFTLIAFDLPYHGHTDWKNSENFTVDGLIEIIQQILPSPHQKIHLLGYSLGGRIALRLLQQMPQRINKTVLLAPDGLHKNKWYRFATQTKIGRKLFYRLMKNPQMLLSVATRLRAMGRIREGYYSMLQYYAGSEESRMHVYWRWISTRFFQPDLPKLRSAIAIYKLPVELVFGKYDKIMVADRGITFAKGLEQYAHVHLLETGHHFLKESYAPFIASLFDDDKQLSL